MLLPDKRRIARLLHRYRTWERRLLAAPSNALARRRFEDTAYTLCILMGRRTAHEAVLAAENYVRSGTAHRGRAQGQERSGGTPRTTETVRGASDRR